jgi:hypothetical protein
MLLLQEPCAVYQPQQGSTGLRLKLTKHAVGCLADEAPQEVLLAGGVQLSDDQLKIALIFCGGLPLALTLLNRALLAEDDPAGLIQNLKEHGSFSIDEEDELVSALSFSVLRLSEELQTAWLYLTLMCLQRTIDLVQLQCLFGVHTLQKLQQRSLITLQGPDWPLPVPQLPAVQVVVHDVLLRMAERMYGPDSGNYCLQLDYAPYPISLSQTVKVTHECDSCMYRGKHIPQTLRYCRQRYTCWFYCFLALKL